MNSFQVEIMVFFALVGILVGGRLGEVIFYHPHYFLENPQDIFRSWEGGNSFHGGFIGVLLAAYLFCRFHKIPLASTCDLIAISAFPGLVLGRIANFINVELWGTPTTMPWGVVFPSEAAQLCPAVEGLCVRHPSQLYEAGLEGFCLGLLLLILAFRGALRFPGLLTGVFFVGYALARFSVEFFRQAEAQFITLMNPNGYVIQYNDFGITMGQALSLPMVFIGLAIIFLSLNQRFLSHNS